MEDDGLPVLPGFREIALRRRRVIEELAGARRAAGLSQTEVAAGRAIASGRGVGAGAGVAA